MNIVVIFHDIDLDVIYGRGLNPLDFFTRIRLLVDVDVLYIIGLETEVIFQVSGGGAAAYFSVETDMNLTS